MSRMLADAVSSIRVKDAYFPDTGDFRRELFPKSLEFFAATPPNRLKLYPTTIRPSPSPPQRHSPSSQQGASWSRAPFRCQLPHSWQVPIRGRS